MVKYTILDKERMDPSIMERTYSWEVLRMISEHPGLTASAVSEGRAHNKTKETRIKEFLAEGIVYAKDGVSMKTLHCTRYYLTEKGKRLVEALHIMDEV